MERPVVCVQDTSVIALLCRTKDKGLRAKGEEQIAGCEEARGRGSEYIRSHAPSLPLLFYALCPTLRVLCSVLLALMLCGFGAYAFLGSPSARRESEVLEYTIGPGDVMQISVWQYDQFNTTATVGPDGKITVHLLGDITVAGLTREGVKEDVTERLSKFIKEGAEVTVGIVEFNSQKISVFGQVRNPRTITFASVPSLVEIIMTECIPTPEADLTAVKIIPADSSVREPIMVNMVQFFEKGDSSRLPKLHPGDTVYVPRIRMEVTEGTASPRVRGDQPQITGGYTTATSPQPSVTQAQGERFIIHVMGAVRSPSTYEFAEEPTLTEVLLKAGSVADSATLKYVRIIRSSQAGMPMPPGDDRVVHVDIDKYLADGDDSSLPRLYSEDIVYIPDVTQEKMKDVSVIVTGQVLRPGTYRTSELLNILDAISLAGGLTENADPEMIRVIRETDDAYHEKIVNIDEFLSDVGSTSRPEIVGPGYRIYVPARRRPTSAVAGAARGLVTFLADLAMVYSFWRVID